MNEENDALRALAFRYLLVLTIVVTTSCTKTVLALTGDYTLALEVFASGILVALPLLFAIYGRWIQAIAIAIAGLRSRENIIEILSKLIDSVANDSANARFVAPIAQKIRNGVIKELSKTEVEV